MSESPIEPAAPTRADRMRLARAHQSKALEEGDPLRATLGIITGDMMVVAHELVDRAGADAAAGTETYPHLKVWLKVVREFERMAAVGRALRDADDEPPRARRLPSEELPN